MPRVGTARLARAKRLLGLLRAAVDSLPTAEEKAATTEALGALTAFISDAQRQLKVLPAREDVLSLQESIQRLEELLVRAESSPLLTAAMGLEKPRARPPAPIAPSDPARAEQVLAVLRDLTVDQIRERLTDQERTSLTELREMASRLGLRIPQRTARDAVVQRLVTAVTNARGYDLLREGEPGAREAAKEAGAAG